ncbi:MAG: LamG-like jellyroll fold domain-containing protein, partial [Microcystis panniformis]
MPYLPSSSLVPLSDGGPTLAISSAGNLLLFIANSNGSGWEIVGFDTQITVSLNEWQHIALVRNDSQLLTYKNGVAGSSVGINFSIASTG